MMGSESVPICDITCGMNLLILRILWLMAQWIIKVEMVSLSPLNYLCCHGLFSLHISLGTETRLEAFTNCSSSV